MAPAKRAPSSPLNPLAPPFKRAKASPITHPTQPPPALLTKPRANAVVAPALALDLKTPNTDTLHGSSLRTYGDKLGTLIRRASALYSASPNWEAFVHASRGRSLISPEVGQIRHPAADYLDELRRQGAPAETMGEPWPLARREAAMRKGCHLSAQMEKEFVRHEMAEFMENGYWTVLPYEQIKHLASLQLSPSAVKTERERKPRFLCDHSIFWVNALTLRLAPAEAMQFGDALPRILWLIRHHDPVHGELLLSKFDIKDGYYRIPLKASDAPMLAVILPAYNGEEPMVAIPLSLTMGWTESPPIFCAASETVADLANRATHRHHVPPHPRLPSTGQHMGESPPTNLAPVPTPQAPRGAHTSRAPPKRPKPRSLVRRRPACDPYRHRRPKLPTKPSDGP
jgi:hypothetical protein